MLGCQLLWNPKEPEFRQLERSCNCYPNTFLKQHYKNPNSFRKHKMEVWINFFSWKLPRWMSWLIFPKENGMYGYHIVSMLLYYFRNVLTWEWPVSQPLFLYSFLGFACLQYLVRISGYFSYKSKKTKAVITDSCPNPMISRSQRIISILW